MALNVSGPISLAGTTAGVSIQIENGGNGTTQISLNDAAVRTLAGVASGAITMPTDFYGKSNRVVVAITISASTKNYVLNTAKAAGYSVGKTDVTLTINGGIVVGSTGTGGIGLDVDTSWNAADTVTIVNNGFIVGAGGNGGLGAQPAPGGISGAVNGSPGGPALRVQRATSITNNGTVGGGGGGGGGGRGASTLGKDPNNVAGGGGGGGQGDVGGGGGGVDGTGNGGAGGSTSGPGAGGAGIPPAFDSGALSGAGGAGGSYGANGGTGGSSMYGGGGSGGGGGAATTAGSNANITWTVTGTRLGTLG